MEELSRVVREFVEIEGAAVSGITTVETLAGGPPSADLTYVLAGARAAVSFAVAIDRRRIPPYLAKQDRLAFEREYVKVNVVASGIALHLAAFLSQKGYPSVPVAANNVFRPPASGSDPHRADDIYSPDLAHRYLAVRCGVGHLGLSGNLIHPQHGAAVILAATVTTAPLVPTPPLPEADNYCDACRLCMASCVAGFMDPREATVVSLGGRPFSYSRRRSYGRCDPVCSGFTGLHASGKWSTWSPGRFPVPERADELQPAFERMREAHGRRPAAPGGRRFFFTDQKLRVSCANCQLVCCPDKKERLARYRMLTRSGVVVQHPDGRLEALRPDAARDHLAALPGNARALYEEDPPCEESP